MTTIKRKPLVEVKPTIQDENMGLEDNMTVEEYLAKQCEEITNDLQRHCDLLKDQIRKEYIEGTASLKLLLTSACKDSSKKLCVTLKCVEGSHMGQKYRLEPMTKNGEESFRIGRATGKSLKEKGVSLYKDKEISTTHAKIEIRNGHVFLVDLRSTNGTILNGKDVEPQVPIRLSENDVIVVGNSHLVVHISDLENQENEAAEEEEDAGDA